MITEKALAHPVKGVRVFDGSDWIGTVWHSNFWGWQWIAKKPGEPWHAGGQCLTKAEGFVRVLEEKSS